MRQSILAHRRKQAKLRIIGSLGEPKRHQRFCPNSGGHPPSRRTMVHQKKLKRRRERPTPKRDKRVDQLVLNRKPHNNIDCGTNKHDQHYYYMHSTSRYWQAHLGASQGGNIPSDNSDIHAIRRAGNEGIAGGKPAKKARICKPFSMQARPCRGNCPPVWTIESFCEYCHG